MNFRLFQKQWVMILLGGMIGLCGSTVLAENSPGTGWADQGPIPTILPPGAGLISPKDQDSLLQPQEQNDVTSVDRGDFYWLANGRKLSYLRKSGTYLLIFQANPERSAQLAATLQTNFSGSLRIITPHAFGNHVMFALQPGENEAALIAKIYRLGGAGFSISPVLTTPEKQGEVLVMPEIVVCLKEAVSFETVMPKLTRLGLTFSSKLAFTDTQFVVKIAGQVEAGKIFELTRKIAKMTEIAWAEPNFLVAPQKTSFIPNDSYFSSQWHLHNTGQGGVAPDSDVDAPEGWDTSKGSGAVIAIIDDGVELTHEDLAIWNNPGESGGGKESNGIDDDGNGYIDDYRGWDFAADYNAQVGLQDNDPSPLYTTDSHGTACAGVAAAVGNNAKGVAGSAPNAVILPIRTGSMYCSTWANAMRYAGKYADVLSNSWAMTSQTCASVFNSAIADVVNGNVTGAKRGNKGSPVLFASGNKAAGWRKIRLTIPSPGTYTFGWFFQKNATTSVAPDTVWLDDLTWPGLATETFDNQTTGSIPTGFAQEGNADWKVVDSDGIHSRGLTGKMVKASTILDSQSAGISIAKTLNSGTFSFWIWVGCEYTNDYYALKQKVSGNWQTISTYSPGQYGEYKDAVEYPANLADTIAVGASDDGGPAGAEERASYSQYGSELDFVAPSGGGYQGIYTVDRTGTAGYSSTNYYNAFSGTSSATPLAAGIAADILAYNSNLSAVQLRSILRDGADKIGQNSYTNARNDYYGYGRINLMKSLQLAACGAEGASCDDGNWCTINDQCHSGQCSGSPRDCSSANDQCNSGVCNETSDSCVAQPANNGQTCNDGLYCTLGETCNSGSCGGGSPRDCASANDQCNSGVCNETIDSCVPQPANNGQTCNDGLYCTLGETCNSGSCGGGSPRNCASVGDQCNSGVCNETSDSCVPQPANNGQACNDGFYCTLGETCNSGSCGGGSPRDCSSFANQCNSGVCNETNDACVAQASNEGLSCDDGNSCTSGETCGSGLCRGGQDSCYVIDNGQLGTSASGTWKASTCAGFYGANSLYSTQADATYTYSAAVTEFYEIWAWWTQWSTRCSKVPIKIYDGTTLLSTIEVNMKMNGGKWNSLGRFGFRGSARVVISSTAASGCDTCADAVKFGYLAVPPLDTLEIRGPASLNEKSSAQYSAFASYSGGALRQITPSSWSIDCSVASVSSAGLVTSSALDLDQNCQLQISYTENGVTKNGTKNITVMNVGIPTEVIIDNGELGTSLTGTWKTSTVKPPYGVSSLYSTTLNATYNYATSLKGFYEVSSWWTSYSTRCTAVPIKIYNGSTLLKTIPSNQRLNGGKWNSLGTYAFGSDAKITVVSSALSGCDTCADAVRFRLAQELFLDNGDPGTSSTGNWNNAVDLASYAADHLSSGENGATYTYQAPVDGSYKLALWWPQSVNNCTNVPVVVYQNDLPLASFLVNQQILGNQWASLGTYAVSGNLKVVITASGSCNTLADALRISNATQTVVDNGAPETSWSGTWLKSSAAYPYGSSSLYTTQSGALYAYNNLVAFGTYAVNLWWTAASSRCAAIPVDIYDSGVLIDTVYVSQKLGGNKWNVIGTYPFSGRVSVVITAPGSCETSADAIKISSVSPGIFIDNGDLGTSFSGNWPASTTADPYGGTSLYSTQLGAKYNYQVSLTGTFETLIWWTQHATRCAAIPIQIYDGTTLLATITADQRSNGGKWVSLGTYTFASKATLIINSPSSTCNTSADAVGFVTAGNP